MTQKKGDLALSYAIYLFTKVGWEVSVPLSESLTYDLVVDDGDLHKVQVKYLGKDVRYVDMRKVHSNAQGYVVNRYDEGDYDWLFVYKEGDGGYLHRSLVVTQTYTPKEEDKLLGRSNPS